MFPLWKKEAEYTLQSLPRLEHVDLGEDVLVPQKTPMRAEPEKACGDVGKFPVCEDVNSGEWLCVGSSPVNEKSTSPFSGTNASRLPSRSLKREAPAGRYHLRQIPKRHALQAEKKRRCGQL